jgi:hypothetical protein
MTVGEGLNVDALMNGVGADPGALIDRVLQQVLQRLVSQGVLAGSTGAASPQDVLAEAIGGWVTRMLDPGADGRSGSYLDWDELLDRNNALAAAVGACDCWGEDRDCAFCDGQGTPGWVRPDGELFAEYVDPAVRWMSTSTTSETANGDEQHDDD